MLEIYVIFFTLFLILLSNYISEKKQFLIDKKFNIHKSFATKKYCSNHWWLNIINFKSIFSQI